MACKKKQEKPVVNGPVELSEEELKKVAGGWTDDPEPPEILPPPEEDRYDPNKGSYSGDISHLHPLPI